ncbi:MAG: malate/lactate/ureidoglycolate dehydrogenase [Caulobacterales bacterium]
MLIPADRLTRLLATMLERAGAPADKAQISAEHLVAANLKGHDSHGVGMAPAYLRWIANGTLFPGRTAKVIHDHVAVMVVDGQFGLGQVVAREAIDLAIGRARQTGIACVALRNACHIGRIGAYGEQCADAGMVSMHYVNVIGGEPAVAPFGGGEPRMITNPYCCTLPRPDGDHIVLDFATSAVAIGKLRVAMMKGEPAPPGALMDAEGQPTDDPRVIFSAGSRGFLLPFGLHKGGGMQVMCELLGGALAGHWTMQPAGKRDYGAAVNNMLSIVIDPDAFGGREVFEAEASAMLDYIHATRPAPGVAAVLAPGDPERASKAQRLRDGVPIDDNSWRDLMAAAASVGLTEAEIAAMN